MRDWKVFTDKEVPVKFYQQSMVTGNPIRVKPNLEMHFGFTINTQIFDLEELQRSVEKLLLNNNLVIVSNTRRTFLDQGGTPMASVELIFVDKESSKSTLQF